MQHLRRTNESDGLCLQWYSEKSFFLGRLLNLTATVGARVNDRLAVVQDASEGSDREFRDALIKVLGQVDMAIATPSDAIFAAMRALAVDGAAKMGALKSEMDAKYEKINLSLPLVIYLDSRAHHLFTVMG